jgi:hypothetical protein
MSIKEEIKKGVACDSVGKPDSILGRAICLSVHPGKMAVFPFIKWFEKRYKHRYKFARLMFSFDLVLLGVLMGLLTALTFSWISVPTSFEDKVLFEATVAPREIVAGAPSTLIIRYTNNTEEELRDSRLNLSFPDHFLLQELSTDDNVFDNDFIELGLIPVGGTGSVRIRGVMFGDVGGEQTFTSTLNFIHGTDSNIPGYKTDLHTFSPVASTLTIELNLPGKLVAFQDVDGLITYNNTGEIDFPVISIEPEWPEGFDYSSSDVTTSNGAFELPAIAAGEQGEMHFTGYLGDVGEEVTFIFHPSFTFETTRYKQETLTHTAPVVPPQVQVEHSVSKSSVRPGSTATFTLEYENTGDFTVTDVVIGIESDSPFFSTPVWESESIPSLTPGQRGQVELNIPLDSFIAQSETDIYEALNLNTRTTASYVLGDGTGQRVIAKGGEVSTPITSPILLESFGRYTTASGDQLGRGPLPPRTGIESKYWVFWHLSGTINEITNLSIEGTLGEGVVFTGRQTSSQNGGVDYNNSTQTVSWSSDNLPTTLSPDSKVVGIAFEVSITPTDSMIGTSPTLLSNITLTGVDSRTGAIISASGPNVTTTLNSDLMAAGKAIVE